MIQFDWDPAKAASNKRKHGVSFEQARTAFFDEFAVQFFGDEVPEGEGRFWMLGLRGAARLLLVCHCERASGRVVRIISARKATKNESRHYQGGTL